MLASQAFLPFTSPKMLPQSHNPPLHTTPPTLSPLIPPAPAKPHEARRPHSPSHPLPPDYPQKPILLPPPQLTHVAVWCGALFCIIFSVLLIINRIIILVPFLIIKPKHPSSDTMSSSLNCIYLNTAEYFNGYLTFLSNYSNPNHKLHVTFEYISIELYFFDRLISRRSLEPFAQRRGETRLESVHMTSSEVHLPLNLSMKLQKQVERNRI